jgi:hypothetical protein
LLNVHFHGIALDGVCVRDHEGDDDDAPLVFHELAPPTRADVEAVASRTAERIEAILRRHGRSLDPELCDDAPLALVSDEPALAACYGAAAQGIALDGDRAGRPTLRLLISPDSTARVTDDNAPVAEVRGVNVHAKQTVHGNDRRGIERLARYVMRPPLSKERLEKRDDGRYELELKSPWRDGTRAFVFTAPSALPRCARAVGLRGLVQRAALVHSGTSRTSSSPGSWLQCFRRGFTPSGISACSRVTHGSAAKSCLSPRPTRRASRHRPPWAISSRSHSTTIRTASHRLGADGDGC